MIGTCGHCENGLIGMILCPRCWGTTVAPKALAEAKVELERVQESYKAKQAANKKLRGRARGYAGQQLSQIGDIARALEAEVDRVERLIKTNRDMARLLGAAAGGGTDG